MKDAFAIVQSGHGIETTVKIHKHDTAAGHAAFPIGPRVSTIDSTRYEEILPDFASEIRHSMLRASTMVEAFATDDLKLGSEALYEITDDLGGTEYISAFPSIEIQGNRYYTYMTSKYLSNLDLRTVKKVKFRTASCLFSNAAARFITADGQLGPSVVINLTDLPAEPFAGLAIDDEFTLYEYETALRLGTMIADIANSLDPAVEIELTLDVPRVQYYLYLIDLYLAGAVSSELMLDWFAAVDQRSVQVTENLKQRITSRLDSERTITLRPPDGLQNLESCLRQQIAQGSKDITVVECIKAFSDGSDPILELLVERRKVQSFRDLGHLSYIAEMLHTGLGDSAEELGIDVVNHIERRVFSYVSKFAPKVLRLCPGKTFGLLCLYPRERVFATDDAWRPSLYRYDPGLFAIDADGQTQDLRRMVDAFYK